MNPVGDGATPAGEAWDGGGDLAGWVWRATAPRADLLLQHGYGEYAERYVHDHGRLIPRLVALGFDVHALDLRGHGRSPGRRGDADVDRAVEDHRRGRRRLGHGGRPLFLFGHSLGGLVTAASVVRDGTGVAGVVLSAPALLIDAPAPLRFAVRTVAAVAPGFGLLPPQSPKGLSRDPAAVARFAGDPMIHHGRVPARLASSALRVAGACWRRYPDWQAPVLVLHGTADSFTDPRGSDRFAERIAATDQQLIRYPEGRHELFNDLDRDAAARAVLDWFDHRAPPSTSR